MLTKAEGKMKAAQIALEAVLEARFVGLDDGDAKLILAELRLIEAWLRGRATGGDKTLGRQLSKELGNQVKPTGKLARQVERLSGGVGREKGGG